MQFDGLRETTTLPAERLESAFQHEDVMAVLPVTEPGSGTATVLVATPRKLGIANLRRFAGKSRWVTRWAPWDAVRLQAGNASEAGRKRQSRAAAVTVGGKPFRSVLGGRSGRVALRDFGRLVQRRRRALADEWLG